MYEILSVFVNQERNSFKKNGRRVIQWQFQDDYFYCYKYFQQNFIFYIVRLHTNAYKTYDNPHKETKIKICRRKWWKIIHIWLTLFPSFFVLFRMETLQVFAL
jgi:hypothetical protein